MQQTLVEFSKLPSSVRMSELQVLIFILSFIGGRHQLMQDVSVVGLPGLALSPNLVMINDHIDMETIF